MKRYIKSNYTSYTNGPRSNYNRKSKKTNARKELYDRVYDTMEEIGNSYADDAVAMNVFSRGPKGSRIVAFRFENSFKKDNGMRSRFNEQEAEDVMMTAQAVVDELGISDRCDIRIESDSILGEKGYTVVIDIGLDPEIID